MATELNDKARQILTTNDKGGFTVPTTGLYPYQWNWDSVLVALGFHTFDESRACREIETLFEAQWDDGLVPHIIFRRDDPDYFPGPSVWGAGGTLPSSGITQPPVAATVVYELWQNATDETVRERYAALFPKLLAWHRWFDQCRVPENIDAVVITHPWESGRDNSVEWDMPAKDIDVSGVGEYERRDLQHADASMRPTKADYDRYLALIYFGRDHDWDQRLIASEGPFRVADVGMTMILLRANRDLVAMAKALDESGAASEIESFVERLENGVDYLWDDHNGVFCSRDTITGKHSGFVTSASFLADYAGVGNEQQRSRMADHWNRICVTAQFMCPSHDPDNSYFDHVRYWRGPTWAIVNYLIAKGFAEQGRERWAEQLKQDSRRLIERSGFYEAFSPITGEGTGGDEFSWTAAMWLAWCGQ
ncbi:MAG: trehalase family glycosidase [Pseudomonadota bacterium]